MLRTPIGRFRAVALAEGISLLVLLGIAVPLKYLAGLPEAVSFVGPVHGVLFLLYVVAVIDVMSELHWGVARVLGALVAAVLPFGTFVLEARLRRERGAAGPA